MKTKIKRKNSMSVYDILATRGVDYNLLFTLDENDKRDAFDFTNMDKVVDLINQAYSGEHKILYVIDTDTDGITSFSIAYNYFKSLYPKKKVDFFMNQGKKHGIFLDEKKIDNLEKDDTLIVFDAASNDIENIKILLDKGVNVIINDHHDIEEKNIDKINTLKEYKNYAICTPQLEKFESHLTGAGMAQKVIEAYDEKFGYENSEFYRDLAAVGCIADMEQFDNEIGYYIDKGLGKIHNLLLNAIVEKNRFNIGNELTAQDVSFSIAPLLNALVRVGSEEERELVIQSIIEPNIVNVPSKKRGAKDGDTEELHDQAARIMNNIKARQKRQVDKAIKEAKRFDNGNTVILLTIEDNKNFTGLIANKIAGEEGRPCLVLWSNDDKAFSGSARCPLDLDYKQFLLDSGFVEFAAGHSQAFGLGCSKKDLDNILDLKLPEIEEYILVDAEIDFDKLNLKDCEELLRFDKFYMSGFERPMIRVNNITTETIYDLGKSFTNKGFNVKPNDKISFIKFNGLTMNELEDVKKSNSIDIVGELNINSYDNSIQFIIKDYLLHENNSDNDYEYEF